MGKHQKDKKEALLRTQELLTVETHEDLDAEAIIQDIQPLQFSWGRRTLFWISVVLTGGIMYLLDLWIFRLHLWLAFSRAELKTATHLLLKTEHARGISPLKNVNFNGGTLMFIFQDLPYFFDGRKFCPLAFESRATAKTLLDKYANGWTQQEQVEDMRSLFGYCAIAVPVKSYLILFYEEFLNPFYLFQMGSVALWFWDEYTYYAIAILVTTIVSLVTSLYQTRKNMERLRDLAQYSCPMQVYRTNWTQIESTYLVPGDLIQVPSGQAMPCDAVLFSGGCVVEEAMLTGESAPVIKDVLPYHEDRVYSVTKDKRHTLYEGTHVIQTRNYNNAPTLAIVVRTGFQSMKGRLIRSILYPKPSKFKFYRDSMLFIAILALIAICGFLTVLPLQLYQGVPSSGIIDRCLDLFTVSVPPALPAAMAVGTAFAIMRLKRQGIFCISPPKVNVAGNVNLCVFDKTGTLTEDGMELKGVQAAVDGAFRGFTNDPEEITTSSRHLAVCMATCHSLTVVNNELMGDSQDLQILHGTGWTFTVPEAHDSAIQGIASPKPPSDLTAFNSDGRVAEIGGLGEEVGVLHIFHFSSQLKRMGVVVQELSTSLTRLCMKGAPEVIVDLCLAHTVPADLTSVLKQLTSKGYRVLACAGKPVDIGYEQLREAKLEELEGRLEFYGLVVLENNLKPQTVPELNRLKAAKIAPIMATGDAILTAVCVGQESGFLDADLPIYFGEAAGEGRINWSTSNQPPSRNWPPEDSQLAVTGEVFYHLHQQAGHSVEAQTQLNSLLKDCKIFARMAPEHKTLLVECLQALNNLVGMCGDGANDCGALKAADVGISLSEAETSVAAPFTSNQPHIECVGVVLREGRCALVTSLQIFKFIALYSTIQFVSVCSLYAIGSNLSDFQFLTIDLFTILPLAITMSYTKPYHILSKHKPIARLVSATVLTSVIGQTFLAGATQVAGYFIIREMPFFEANNYEAGTDPSEYWFCMENSIIFLISWYQYISICLVYSIGKPWKKPAYTNYYLVVNAGLVVVASVYCIFWPAWWAREAVQIENFPFYFRMIMLGICLGYSLLSYLLEKYVVFYISQKTKRRY